MKSLLLFGLVVVIIVSLSSCQYPSITTGPNYRPHVTKNRVYKGRTSAPSDLTQVRCKKVKSKKFKN